MIFIDHPFYEFTKKGVDPKYNIGTQGVQELFFLNWKVAEIAELNQWHVKMFY